jgi:hypothetical protein
MKRCANAGDEKVYLQFPRMTVNLRRCKRCKKIDQSFFETRPVPFEKASLIGQKEVPGRLLKKIRRIIREMNSWPEIL